MGNQFVGFTITLENAKNTSIPKPIVRWIIPRVTCVWQPTIWRYIVHCLSTRPTFNAFKKPIPFWIHALPTIRPKPYWEIPLYGSTSSRCHHHHHHHSYLHTTTTTTITVVIVFWTIIINCIGVANSNAKKPKSWHACQQDRRFSMWGPISEIPSLP